MKLKLTVTSASETTDVVLTADTTATVAAIAQHIAARYPQPRSGDQPGGLVVNAGTSRERTVVATQTLADAGIRSGDSIALTASDQQRGTAGIPAATLNVIEGPDAPAEYALVSGTNLVGRDRDCDVRLDDPLISKRHARINVSDVVEIIDDGSANGIAIGNDYVDRAVLPAGTHVTLGDTVLSVTLHSAEAAVDDGVGAVAFNRSPRLDPRYVGVELQAPEPPRPQRPQRFPIATLLAPVMMGGMIYAVTRNVTSILFVGLSPLMLIGGWIENRIASRRSMRQATDAFRSALVDLSVQLQYAADQERAGRRCEHPSASEVVDAIRDLTPLTWTRRPEHDSFLTFRLGLGTQPSRNSVSVPNRHDGPAELWRELTDVVGRFSTIDRVPVVADLRASGNVGVAGPPANADPVMANVIGQIIGTHSPAEVVLAAVAAASSHAWEWLKWLPHVGSEFSPIEVSHLASDPAAATSLVAAIEQLIDNRAAEMGGNDPAPLPAVIVYVNDDAPAERSRLVQIAERGPNVGVHVAWQAVTVARLPAACRTYVDVGPGVEHAGFVIEGNNIDDLEAERVTGSDAARLARALAPVIDSGVRVSDQSDLARSVPFLAIAGSDIAHNPSTVVDQWVANHSLPTGSTTRRTRDNTLRALVGQSADGPFHLDLRTHGPHALVGGTTGAGKSEFLQTWVLAMAAMHSPARVTFLFVDYKGGSAFADCIDLPHSVGLVTDLSPHLVRRALTSLNAELHHRELVLNAKRAKDLLELERRNDPDAPPSLVIVVDEFAALVNEVPEFVDGVVNIAQRGRSLGLHLILATQRPAGVIRDNLRANTNLRVALRMADEDDSTDVIGTPLAATFDPAIPGRAVAKTGPGRLTAFQSAYVGGHTTGEPTKPTIEIRDLAFGPGGIWDPPAETYGPPDVGPNDSNRLVSTIREAFDTSELAMPRRPWLDELAHTYRLEDLPSRRTDTELVFGVRDAPASQAQPEIAFLPDDDANMAVFGTSGTGKTVFLRTMAIAAGFAPARGGPCHVYGIDFGARGLQLLETLPHVGSIIPGDDTERVQRLLRTLKEIADDRAIRYADARADTVTEYRNLADRPDEPRIIVLIDGIGAFRNTYEATALAASWDTFQSLATDGRGVGIHFSVTADRPGAISSGFASSIQKRLVLRLANDMDYVMADAPADGFTAASPPGRGFIDGNEVQIAVLGGSPNAATQTAAINKLADAMTRQDIEPAPPIRSLPDNVALRDLPVTVGALPTLGLWDQALEPIGLNPTGTFVVSGPPHSGRTTTVAAIVQSLRRAQPDMPLAYLTLRPSPLSATVDWDRLAVGSEAIDTLAGELLATLQEPNTRKWTIIIENIGELLNTDCDLTVQDLIKVAHTNDHFVIAEGETSTLTGSWPLLQAVKASRTGIVLQPDQMDGDTLFKTPFPRIRRADLPPGRGLLAVAGKAYRVQVASPG